MVFFGGSITTGDSFFRRESVAGAFLLEMACRTRGRPECAPRALRVLPHSHDSGSLLCRFGHSRDSGPARRGLVGSLVFFH